ncbi:Uncharacterised protein [Rothia dentocariosa]|uniref:Uncharacterized protein n=1 Tax=Rothia dentocariosa TaxID=2047 RepID=A0A3S5BU31_9MICC|nr:Uncharacterised protein [Rothia dentocariosa]
MVYEKEYKDEFIVPVFTQESGYWEKVMKPRLQEQGWYIAEVDCANVEDIEDCGTRLLRELNFKVPEHGYINAMGVKDNITDIYGINIRKGLFVFYKNFEDIFSTHPDLHQGYGAEFMLQLIEHMVYHYSDLRGYIYEEFPVVVGYGVGLPTSYIPQFEELMGAENVMIAGEGVRYPGPILRKNSAETSRMVPRTLCTISMGSFLVLLPIVRRLRVFMLMILGIILNHRFMTLFLPQRYTWCIVNLLSQIPLYKRYGV